MLKFKYSGRLVDFCSPIREDNTFIFKTVDEFTLYTIMLAANKAKWL